MARISNAEAKAIQERVDRALAAQKTKAAQPSWTKPQAHLPKGKK